MVARYLRGVGGESPGVFEVGGVRDEGAWVGEFGVKCGCACEAEVRVDGRGD